jgi:hypothetical protein
MEHGKLRKLIKATMLSVLVLTTSGMTGLAVMAGTFAMSQPDGLGGGLVQALGSEQPEPPTPTPLPSPTPTPPLPIP